MSLSAEQRSRVGRRTGKLPSEITNLSIAVALHGDGGCDLLIRELRRARSSVRHIWPIPERLPEDTNVIYCDLMPGLPDHLPWVPGTPTAALVVTIPVATSLDLELIRNCCPDAILHRPITKHAVLTSLILAWTRFKYEQRLRTRIEKLDDTLRTVHNVERAKAILMAREGIGEEEAYHLMRRQAMAQRVPIGVVASAIVESHEMLK